MMHKSKVGQTEYTAEHDTKSGTPFVKLTRYNRDGKTEIWFPTELLWRLFADKIRERVLSLVDTHMLKDLLTWRP